MELTAENWQSRLRVVARREKAAILSSFFKTGKGEYGEGDIFIGVTVPDNRAVARDFRQAPLEEIGCMLDSPVHEFRLSGFLALVERFRGSRRDPSARRAIVDFYLANAGKANNWDLVDLSAYKILGVWMVDHPDSALLDRMSEDDSIWIKRIAIVSTYALIRAGRYDDTLRLAERYLTHPHQLIHKATGWMLREIGKRDLPVLTGFLQAYAPVMPRTALRYAVEKLPDADRRYFMSLS